MAAPIVFGYNINTTGDCSHNSSGAISILLSGGTPPYTVQWVNPVFPTDTITTEPDVKTNLPFGTYSVRVNDSTLPTNASFYINIPVSSGVCGSILGVANTTCSFDNGAVTATSTSNYSSTNFYLFNSADTFISSATTNVAEAYFNGLSAGTYYITVLDLGGCTAKTSNFIVQESMPFDFGLYTVPNSSCGGTPIGKIFVTGQTGLLPYTYLWNNGDTGSTTTGLTKGTYSVQVTDSLGCSLTKSTAVTDVPPVGFGVFNSTQPTCFSSDGSISLTVTGGTAPYYYSASTGDVLISYSQTYTLSNIPAGQYNFLVTDAGLCSFSVGTNLLAPSGITSVDVSAVGSTCSSTNGSISITVNGGVAPYVYTLIYPNGNSLKVSNSLTTYVFTNLYSGTYTIAAEDSTGCAYITEKTLFTTDSFTITTSTVDTSCNQNNGSITVTKSVGGLSPFDYSLDNGAVNVYDTTLSAVTFSNVAAGQHSISVTDASGCTQTEQVYVSPSVNLDFSVYSTSCGTGNNGSITTFISSGTPPFKFTWSDNIPSNPQQIQVTGLTAGTYSVTIVDDNGCSLKRTATIDCFESYASYQSYVMGSEVFQVQSPTKLGLLQMLNEGYSDITVGNTNCDLVSAIFTTKVTVQPLRTVVTNSFFTATSLINAPSDNLWYNTIRNLLLSITGVGRVTIDELNNQITIETSRGNNSLNGQEIIVELVINYDIMCLT